MKHFVHLRIVLFLAGLMAGIRNVSEWKKEGKFEKLADLPKLADSCADKAVVRKVPVYNTMVSDLFWEVAFLKKQRHL